MIGASGLLERLTFLLALIGYAGLTIAAIRTAAGRPAGLVWRSTVPLIVAHVALVWGVRYGWQLGVATRNGYAGFLIFHGALALIIASVVVSEGRARVSIWAAFAVVSVGALGAVFRYDVVLVYRAPVILLAATGTMGLVRAGVRARASRIEGWRSGSGAVPR